MSRLSIVGAVIGAALLGLLIGPMASVQAAEELGPSVGARVPDIGSPPDQTGAPRNLQSLMGEKGLVLFFFRSAEWCPFCQAQMIDLNTALPALERRGYRMAGISFDSPQNLKTFIERRQIGYTLLPSGTERETRYVRSETGDGQQFLIPLAVSLPLRVVLDWRAMLPK